MAGNKRRNTSTGTTVARKKVKVERLEQTGGHRIITRSRAKEFRFSDLPAEIRNNIYDHTFKTDAPLELSEFKVPSVLQTSHQLRQEASWMAISSTCFTMSVRGNFCVAGLHKTSTHHPFFEHTGELYLPSSVRKYLVGHQSLFQVFEIKVTCCCCYVAKVLFTVTVDLLAEKPIVYTPSPTLTARTLKGMDVFRTFAVVDFTNTMKEITDREGYKGVSIHELERLCGDFRVPWNKKGVRGGPEM